MLKKNNLNKNMASMMPIKINKNQETTVLTLLK
jgi:hypothetical protein